MKWSEGQQAVGRDRTIYRVDPDGSLHIFWANEYLGRTPAEKARGDPRKPLESHCPLGLGVKSARHIADLVDEMAER